MNEDGLGSQKVCPYCAETIKAAATVCRFCQRNLEPGAAPPISREHERQPATRIIVESPKKSSGCGTGCLVIIVTVCLLYLIGSCSKDDSTSGGTSSPSSSRSSSSKVTQERWDAVSAVFEKAGATIGPRDPQYPDCMDVYLPSSVAMDITERQAKEMAVTGPQQTGRRLRRADQNSGGPVNCQSGSVGLMTINSGLLNRAALSLSMVALALVTVALYQTRRQMGCARNEARVVRLEADDATDRANVAEDALRQEIDRQQMIASGALTPIWLSRRLALERGVIYPSQEKSGNKKR